ncbi:hypothetical protein [Legionella oakridgensis]|uniref:Uncharacterized protein n=2 Tax=Legionella oakridgensis TaxID=29423 RepID=W0B770_9GAMM|nr:hypothetical protein [Legionella oakridgensis]AHE66388.1 hypothetical protein Loa_00820 [Legionella oakridgensis ATCC 33761 = DSM 21215]ETO93891.1 hypothetical protein LOR_37c04240 [Legionella oakridgensis RV-2-2007]KTD44026.1 hypothetical protein Loak_0286 [Legionella oakridgensis]STY19569.1 Uncharacterised protein [Legionella longbeachae]
MGKEIYKILHPKTAGLTGKRKPIALVIHSPNDDEAGTSVDFTSAIDFVTDIGYGKMNTARKFSFPITEDGLADDEQLQASIRTGGKPPESLTLWLESHGAPGWLFAGPREARAEFLATLNFARFVRQLERFSGTSIDNIVLSGCFTANEYYNAESSVYFNSPARMLSFLLPEKKIVGFVGQHACAKVSNVYRKTGDDTYTSVYVNPEDAAVLYQNGAVLEAYEEELYCNHAYTPPFINKHCALGLTAETKATTFYRPCQARELVASDPYKYYVEEDSYGEKQTRSAAKALARLQEETLLVAAEETAEATSLTV